MKPADKRYSFSFISGALYVPESLVLGRILATGAAWDEAVGLALRDNLLRQRKEASSVRLLREIRYRLEQLDRPALDFLCHARSPDQRHLLYIAVCKRYRFIREFTLEVLRPKALSLDLQLYPADLARFIDRKGSESPEVDRLTDKSIAKIRQVILRMLAEASLLDSTANQRLTPRLPSKALARLVAKGDPGLLRLLLLSDADIRQITA
jgi:hypothetical protein